MMNRLKTIDKITITICILVISICSILLSDLGTFRDFRSDGERIGEIEIVGEDVRKKISSEYFWQNIRGLNNIYSGDSFYAGQNSSASIKTEDGTELRLNENSSIKFTSKKNKLSIDIMFGQVRVDAKTKFVVIKDCNKEIMVESQGSSFDIQKGQECGNVKIKSAGRIRVGAPSANTEKTSLEKVLKSMTGLKNVKARIQLTASGELEFIANWDHLKNASNYELELSSEPNMIADLRSFQIKENTITIPQVKEEKLYYRLRVIDAEQKTGEFGPVAIAIVKESLDIPQVLNAELKASVGAKELSLSASWLPITKAESYQVEVSESPDFANLSAIVVSDSRTLVSGLKKIPVYLRLRAQNRYVKSAFSETVIINSVTESIPVPRINLARMEAHGPNELALNLSWKPIEAIKQYHIEVSESADFTKPVVQTVKTSTTRILPLKNTSIYARVRAEGKYGYSQFSDTVFVAFKYSPSGKSENIITSDCHVTHQAITGSEKNFNVSWEPVPMAAEYQVKIIDNKKADQLAQVKTRAPASSVLIPGCGDYSVNVEAYDQSGRSISSEFKASKILYRATLMLLRPGISEAQKNLNIFFQKAEGRFVWIKWLADVKSDTFYRIELATDAGFTENYRKFDVRDNKFLLKSIFKSNRYFWRVREQKGTLFSEWSDIAQIKIDTKNPDID